VCVRSDYQVAACTLCIRMYQWQRDVVVVIVWINNYLCNQCLSPLMLWVRISIRTRCTTLCNKVCQWLATFRCLLRVLRFPPLLKLTTTI